MFDNKNLNVKISKVLFEDIKRVLEYDRGRTFYNLNHFLTCAVLDRVDQELERLSERRPTRKEPEGYGFPKRPVLKKVIREEPREEPAEEEEPEAEEVQEIEEPKPRGRPRLK